MTPMLSKQCSTHPIFPHDLKNLFSKKISSEENENFCKIPTNEEILKTIKQLPSSKYPGPYDFMDFFSKQL